MTTKTDTLDTYLNPYTLAILNVLIIVVTLTVGHGEFFIQTGLVHIIALLFIALAVSRIFFHYNTHDPILEKYVHATMLAMGVFAMSHIVEFVSFVVLKQYQDAVFVNVTNFYLISMLIITIGAQQFVQYRHPIYSMWLRCAGLLGILALSVTTIAILVNDTLVSLEPDEAAPYIYLGLLIICTFLALRETAHIGRFTSVAKKFAGYITAAVALIFLATLPNIFYEVLEKTFNASETFSVYASHFTFYAALSLFFLAFRSFAHLGGIYKEIE